MKLLHQCGHCTKWNVESFQDDGCGDGLILSPVHERKTTLEKHSDDLKRHSLFDAQFYLPNSQKQKLHTYDFFPEVVADGFSTLNFTGVARRAARLCLDFQFQQDYESILIPARHFEQMDPDYTDKQDAYTVQPFLHELAKLQYDKEVILTLPLTSHMVASDTYRTHILNWVTSYPEISGVYVIVQFDRKTKQVADSEFLKSMLVMLTELRAADLSVTVGYTNTESLLYTLVDDVNITFGAYENTRMFSMDKFLVNDEDRRGPRARIYLPGLLNWIQFNQAETIRNEDPDTWNEIYSPTHWGEQAFGQATPPHFSQPGLYRHYFISFSQQFEQLKNVGRLQRYETLRTWIRTAQAAYQEVENNAIDLDPHGLGTHLQPWLDAIGAYYRKFIRT